MVALVEDQMHQFLIAQEELRCRAIEAENNKNEETKDKEVKRKKIPKPWTRSTASTLCQEANLLVFVCEYDYDLSIKDFQDYCSNRGILHVAGEPGSERWKFIADFRNGKSAFLANRKFQFAEEVNGKQYRFTDDQMETHWKIIILSRAKLQDCWELFSTERKFSEGE